MDDVLRRYEMEYCENLCICRAKQTYSLNWTLRDSPDNLLWAPLSCWSTRPLKRIKASRVRGESVTGNLNQYRKTHWYAHVYLCKLWERCFIYVYRKVLTCWGSPPKNTLQSPILKMHFPARCAGQPKCALGDGGSRHQPLSVNNDCVSTAGLFANTQVAPASLQPLVRNPTMTRDGGTSRMRRGRCACASPPSSILAPRCAQIYRSLFWVFFCFFAFFIKAANDKTKGRRARMDDIMTMWWDPTVSNRTDNEA